MHSPVLHKPLIKALSKRISCLQASVLSVVWATTQEQMTHSKKLIIQKANALRVLFEIQV